MSNGVSPDSLAESQGRVRRLQNLALRIAYKTSAETRMLEARSPAGGAVEVPGS